MRMDRRTLVAIVAAVASALPAHAQQDAPPSRPPSKAVPVKAKPLSPEDAAVVKELALLENVDLLRNLELFEDKKQDDSGPQKKPSPGGEPGGEP
jgi:hypothetical protein